MLGDAEVAEAPPSLKANMAPQDWCDPNSSEEELGLDMEYMESHGSVEQRRRLARATSHGDGEQRLRPLSNTLYYVWPRGNRAKATKTPNKIRYNR